MGLCDKGEPVCAIEKRTGWVSLFRAIFFVPLVPLDCACEPEARPASGCSQRERSIGIRDNVWLTTIFNHKQVNVMNGDRVWFLWADFLASERVDPAAGRRSYRARRLVSLVSAATEPSDCSNGRCQFVRLARSGANEQSLWCLCNLRRPGNKPIDHHWARLVASTLSGASGRR